MFSKPKPFARKASLIALALLVLFSGPACAITLFKWPELPGYTPQPPTPSIPTATPLPMAQVTFRASLVIPLAPSERLSLRVFDLATGLGYNFTDYPMQPRDALNYSVSVPLALNSVVAYRYFREGNNAHETNAFGQPVLYRMYYVTGSAETVDLVTAFADHPYGGQTGTIKGTTINSDTGAAIPNLLVTAGGVQSISDSTGRFVLQGLPIGTHTVVGYAMDGSFATFQQGATVDQGLATPVEVRVRPQALAPVTLTVHVPENTQEGAPLRIAGNLLQLGATFADLRGGSSTVADHMTYLNYTGNHIYSGTIYLPAGADVRYKYTLGDGLWNAERNGNGDLQTRQMIVPANGVTVEEAVYQWESGHSAPISFEVTVPPETPAGEHIYIQFKTSDWTEPVPMWSVRDKVWKYILYAPLDRSVFYRYCRSGQCGAADDEMTAGDSAFGRQIGTAMMGQDIRDDVSRWIWLRDNGPASLAGSSVVRRPDNFMAGVEFTSTYRPNISASIPQAIQNVQALGSNWVFITPTWTYQTVNPLLFGPRPGADPLWNESTLTISLARALNLNVGVFPQPRFPASSTDFWMGATRDATWWQNWFDNYRAFALNYADLAQQANAQGIVLGGDWIAPALPNGTLPDGKPSNVPTDADTRWQVLINEVRAHFRGQILWAMPYSPTGMSTPAFIAQTDGVYLLISGSLSESLSPSKQEMEAAAAALLDNGVAPLQSMLGKPIYLAFGYPSVNGSTANCLPANSVTCLKWDSLNQPTADRAELSLNLQLQADIYEVLLAAVNVRPWVSGVVSRGYYSPALLQDKSASIHGKPAGDVLWYWYRRFLGLAQ